MDANTLLPRVGLDARFRQRCEWVAAIWLGLTVLIGFLSRPMSQDFSAFYMGGHLAAEGRWEWLYPLPNPASPYFVGQTPLIKPEHRRVAEELHVQELYAYLQPPWNAILFIPLGTLPFQLAWGLWIALSTFCGWRLACIGGRWVAQSPGGSARWAGWITLLIAFSPLMYRAIRVGNVSVVVAWCIALAVDAIKQGDRPLASPAILLGSVLKYAPAVLVPLVIVQRRWKTLAALALGGVLIVGGTCWMTGSSVWQEYFHVVAPSMARSSPHTTNQSVWGFLIRIRGNQPLTPGLTHGVHILEWTLGLLTLAAVAWQGWRQKLSDGQLMAAAVMLLGWLLVFGPLVWPQYLTYLMPFWGWMLCGARRGWWRGVAWASVALMYLPLCAVQSIPHPEPLNSHPLLATLLMTLSAWHQFLTSPKHVLAVDEQQSGMLRPLGKGGPER